MIGRIRTYWMQLARLLAAVNSAVLLTIVFFCVLTPAGLLLRLFRRQDPLSSAAAGSQWSPFPADADPGKPF
jgi:hypothetical protein